LSRAIWPISTVCQQVSAGVEVIFHEAALPSVPRSVLDPIGSNVACVDATVNLLWAAKEAGVRRVVYAASSSAYGDTPTLPKHEQMLPNPISPYAVAKLTGEYYMRSFARVYGLETVALRYFNVFGPYQDPLRSIRECWRCFAARCWPGSSLRSTATARRAGISRSFKTRLRGICWRLRLRRSWFRGE
jgi:nucleoside-diphosphate-sugar epimerase